MCCGLCANMHRCSLCHWRRHWFLKPKKHIFFHFVLDWVGVKEGSSPSLEPCFRKRARPPTWSNLVWLSWVRSSPIFFLFFFLIFVKRVEPWRRRGEDWRRGGEIEEIGLGVEVKNCFICKKLLLLWSGSSSVENERRRMGFGDLRGGRRIGERQSVFHFPPPWIKDA